MNYINTADGIKIAIQDLNPKSKKTILFLHGWPLSRKIFEYQINVLSRLGYRVILVDFRGFGDSDTSSSGYDYNQMASDVNTVISTLNLRNIILAGFSMGGAIAIRYMANYKQNRVEKLALIGAAAPSFTKTPSHPYGMSKEDVDKLIAKTYKDRPRMAYEFGQSLFASNPSKELRDYFYNISLSASSLGTIGGAISLRDEDLTNDLTKITVPTGIFHGVLDKICPFGFANELHDAIKNSRIYRYESSGHALFYDELDKFNKEFIEFIK